MPIGYEETRGRALTTTDLRTIRDGMQAAEEAFSTPRHFDMPASTGVRLADGRLLMVGVEGRLTTEWNQDRDGYSRVPLSVEPFVTGFADDRSVVRFRIPTGTEQGWRSWYIDRMPIEIGGLVVMRPDIGPLTADYHFATTLFGVVVTVGFRLAGDTLADEAQRIPARAVRGGLKHAYLSVMGAACPWLTQGAISRMMTGIVPVIESLLRGQDVDTAGVDRAENPRVRLTNQVQGLPGISTVVEPLDMLLQPVANDGEEPQARAGVRLGDRKRSLDL